MISEPGAVDAGVLAALRADAPLMAFCNNALFFGTAPQGYETFVAVDRLSGLVDRNCFGEAAGETFLYQVKAVTPGTDTNAVRQAAARIRELLDGCETLAADGYALQGPIEEVESLRLDDFDPANPDRVALIWGGRYEIAVQPIARMRRRS